VFLIYFSSNGEVISVITSLIFSFIFTSFFCSFYIFSFLFFSRKATEKTC